jgi:hypothetical protein
MLHFFGVFDGHGGDQAANHCAARLHKHLCEALGHNVSETASATEGHETPPTLAVISEETSLPMYPSISDHAVESKVTGAQGGKDGVDHAEIGPGSDLKPHSIGGDDASCPVERVLRDDAIVEEALRDAFLKTDEEFGSDICASMVGSTAVVAILGKNKIWIANCGESHGMIRYKFVLTVQISVIQ